jgi:WD40 repeat protein
MPQKPLKTEGPNSTITQVSDLSVVERQVAEAQVALDWKVGDVILDQYEVIDLLGEGGMGKVYKVHHRGWNTDLAVKCPKPEELKRAGGAANFTRECETWVNLGLHPHIVSCYYVRTLGGVPRVFAECIEGGSLKGWIDTRKALERMLDIAIQFAWGLHYAHEQGLVHQDVKPANALLATDGTVKVTDFGLAKARGMSGAVEAPSGHSILVSTGGMTPAYCSPEQAARQPITRKTDVWSWGVSILEMFVGEVTWLAGQAATEALTGYLESGPVEKNIPKMPAELTKLLQRCFQKKPDARPKDMLEIATRVQSIYNFIMNAPYFRSIPQALELRADSLNNRAVSLFDLGKTAEANLAWEQALRIDPQHLESTVNSGYQAWDNGKLDDLQYLQKIQNLSLRHSHENEYWYSLALVHSERGDGDQAANALKNIRPGNTRLPTEINCSVSLRNSKTYPLPAVPICAAVSPNGRLIACGLADNSILVLDSIPPNTDRRSNIHNEPIYSIQFTMDSAHLITGSYSNSLTVWDLASLSAIQKLGSSNPAGIPNGVEKASAMAVLPHQRIVAVGSNTGGAYTTREFQPILLWDLAKGSITRILPGHQGKVVATSRSMTNPRSKEENLYGGGVCCFTVSDNGEFLFSGGYYGQIKIWHIPSGRCQGELSDKENVILCISLSPDQKTIASGGSDGIIKIWDLQTLSCTAILPGHVGSVRTINYLPDGSHVFSTGDDGTIRFWDLHRLNCIRTAEEHSGAVDAAGVIPQSSGIFSAGKDRTLRIWEHKPWITPYNSLLLAVPRAYQNLTDEKKRVNVLTHKADTLFQQKKSQEAYDCLREAQEIPGYETSLDILDRINLCAREGKPTSIKNSWLIRTLKHSTSPIHSMAFSKDGKYLLSGTVNHAIDLWDLVSGEHIKNLAGHQNGRIVVAYSSDGRHAFSGSKTTAINGEAVLKYWEVPSGRYVHDFKNHSGGITAIAVNPMQDIIATAGWQKGPKLDGNAIRIWDVPRKSQRKVLEGHSDLVESVVFSQNGSLLASGSRDRNVILWDMHALKVLTILKDHEGTIYSLAFSPDSNFLLSCGTDDTVRLWDIRTRKCIRVFQGHKETVRSVSFSPDGAFVLSGGDDLTINLWSTETGKCIGAFGGHKDGVTGVSFSADGRYAWSCSYDGSIQQWELDWHLRFEGSESTISS